MEINAAFEKLFRNGQAAYFTDLGKERVEKFINKPVQYYLPWRVVYKADSLTTPCRPVFDASTKNEKEIGRIWWR